MQKEFDSLRMNGGEEINKQLEKLVLGSVDNETESETNSDESGASSCGDETDAFEESFEFENDLGKLGGWLTEEGELSLESDEEAALNEEIESTLSDGSLDEPGSNEIELPSEPPGSSTAGNESFQSQNEHILKLKEIQTEIDNLKEMIDEFAKGIKSSLTEIIFEQFSQLESELSADGEKAR